MTERWTVIKILKWTTDYFSEKGIDSPRLDAEVLLAETLGMDRVGLYVNFDQPLAADELARFRERVRRRGRHEPVQYILGETEFWSMAFAVNPQVLIPRADTEVLVEEALTVLPDRASVLDAGTGSGAIAIALAKERPELTVLALDVSSDAVQVAQRNAMHHQVQAQIKCQVGDLAALPTGPYDLLVSNPPYIPSQDWQGLMPEVRDYEPRLALDGGVDGLQAYRLLSQQAVTHLKPGGWLMVEVGINQAEEVAELFAAAGLTEIRKREDYAGIPRVVAGRRKV